MKWKLTWSLALSLVGTLSACSKASESSEPEIKTRPEVALKAQTPLNVAGETAPLPPAPQEPPPPPSPQPSKAETQNCVGFGPNVKVPYFVAKPSVFLINFLKTCTTATGEPGFAKGSSWTAMGFPCTHGRGRIDKRGSDSTPNLIHFMLQTSCPMEPASAAEAEKVVRQKLRMPEDSNLIAYYPFSVQYWEFVQFPEKDTGPSPTLYSAPGISQGWQKFANKNEPIRVKLYGRENAWERGKNLFEVEALLQPDGRSSFKLNIVQAKAMSDEEKSAVLARCDEIKPKKNCGEIFVD